MENIFEGAKFGDKFVTKAGFQAIYCKYCTKDGSNWYHIMIVDCEGVADLEYDNNGVAIACCDDFDIVSKYQEPVDEETLREKAYEWTSFVKEDNLTIKVLALECAMIGYRKAKEEMQ